MTCILKTTWWHHNHDMHSQNYYCLKYPIYTCTIINSISSWLSSHNHPELVSSSTPSLHGYHHIITPLITQNCLSRIMSLSLCMLRFKNIAVFFLCGLSRWWRICCLYILFFITWWEARTRCADIIIIAIVVVVDSTITIIWFYSHQDLINHSFPQFQSILSSSSSSPPPPPPPPSSSSSSLSPSSSSSPLTQSHLPGHKVLLRGKPLLFVEYLVVCLVGVIWVE